MYLCKTLKLTQKTMFSEMLHIQLIITGIVLLSLLIIRAITNFTITKVARKNGINEARIRLMRRYVTVTLFLIAILIEAFVFELDLKS